MKYVITDLNEVNIGGGLHQDLAENLKGKVIAAGECERLEDGWTVYGRSYGLHIQAKNSDRELLDTLLPTHPTSEISD